MLVPAIQSIGMRSSSRTCRTPTCAAPLAPPPPSASPIRGRAEFSTSSGDDDKDCATPNSQKSEVRMVAVIKKNLQEMGTSSLSIFNVLQKLWRIFQLCHRAEAELFESTQIHLVVLNSISGVWPEEYFYLSRCRGHFR